MSVQNKPDYKIFADGAKPGEVVPFPDVLRGWGVTLDTTGGVPPMEFFNSFGKRLNEWLMYLTQQGIPEWDSTVDYPKNAVIKSNGTAYISKEENKDKPPATNQSSWDVFALSKSDIVQETGSQTTRIMSQEAVTRYLLVKFNKSDVLQTTGSNEDKVMSQKSVTDELNKRLNKSDVLQSTGNSKTAVISQDGVTKTFAQKSELPTLPFIGSGSKRTGKTSTRQLGITYTNDKPYSIFVTVMLQSTARDSNLITRMRINDIPASNFYIGTRGNDTDILAEGTHSQLVLPGESYIITSSPNSKVVSWVEVEQR